MPFKLIGTKRVISNLEAASRTIAGEAERSLFREAHDIMSDSKTNYVPVMDGVLRSTGQVHDPKVTKGAISVMLSYGGSIAPYAIAVHENPSEHDPPSWKGVEVDFKSPKGPKYLEQPMRNAVLNMSGRIASRMKV